MSPSQAQAQARLENSQVRRTLETSKTRRIFMNLLASNIYITPDVKRLYEVLVTNFEI